MLLNTQQLFFWAKNYSLLFKYTTVGQHRDIAQGCTEWLDQSDLLSKTGLCLSKIQTIHAWLSESSITAFVLLRHMGKRGFGSHHANISKDGPMGLDLPCFPERPLIICLSWDGGNSVNISELLSFLLKTYASSVPWVHSICTVFRKSY